MSKDFEINKNSFDLHFDQDSSKWKILLMTVLIIVFVIIAVVMLIIIAILMVATIITLFAMILAAPIWFIWSVIAPYGLAIGYWQWVGVVIIVRLLFGKGFHTQYQAVKNWYRSNNDKQ